MYKKICIFTLISLLMLTMVGCSNNPSGSGNPESSNSMQESDPNDHSPDNGGNKTQNEMQDNTPVGNSNAATGEENNTQTGGGGSNANPTAPNPFPGQNDIDTSTDNGGTTDSGSGTVTTVPENPEDCTYEEYHAMTPEAQKQFFAKFENVQKFFEWYKLAKLRHEKGNAAIEIGNGEIDLDEVIGGEE